MEEMMLRVRSGAALVNIEEHPTASSLAHVVEKKGER
jgi:hypothetical protein